MFRRTGLLAPLLLLLTACPEPFTDPPPSTDPSLTLSPSAINVNAGETATTFIATVQNSDETVSWTLAGPGSIAPLSGATTLYTPPESIDGTQSATLTATLGSAGVSASALITVYPASVTPPPDPPPSEPPPTDPPPTDPPANDFEVEINGPSTRPAVVNATTSLQATVTNATGSVTYAWTLAEGPMGQATFSDATAQNTDVTFGVADTYVIRLTATDSSGESDSDEATFNVSAATANTAPTVDIQGEVSQEAIVNEPKTLTAVGTDPENDSLTYQWNVNFGDANGVVFSAPNSATTTVTFPNGGYRSVRVTVTDPGGLTDSDDVDIQVLVPQ